MSIPTPEEWKVFGEVMFTWGIGFIICGLITLVIGVIIIGTVMFCDYKSEIKFIK